jgi:hypothetical protein
MSRPKPISAMSVSECFAEISALEKQIESDTKSVEDHVAFLRKRLIEGDLGIFLTTKSQELAGAKEILAILPERLKPLRVRIFELNQRIESEQNKTK